jgi:adenine-specific DNA-methyltransferase
MPSLEFKGKSVIRTHHLTLPYRQLVPEPKLSLTQKPNLQDNLIIHGDNLLALKALLPSYSGKVDLIYIDPPYNTGNEKWRYNDNVNSPMHQEWLKKEVDREDLTRHDKWLCMMWPRLILLKEMLKEDGIIFVSIDDNEAHHLRAIMDEIFDGNFIAQLVWEKGRKNDAKLFSVGHEYMLVYARSLETLKSKKTVWREPKPGAKEIWEKYLELREKYGDDDKVVEGELQEWYRDLPARHPSKALSRYKHIDKYGPWRDRDISWPGGGGPKYDVIHPVTKQPCKIPDAGWRFSTPEAMQQQIDLGLIEFREDHTQPPFRKAHLRPVFEELDESEEVVDEEEPEDNSASSSEGNGDSDSGDVGMQVMPSVIYKQSQVAVKYLRKLMGAKVFDNPKDHEVIGRIIHYVTASNKNAVILDSFAGSGTTGQAVLEVNAEDKGNRRFILIEQEDYADSLTAERVRRVIQGVSRAKDSTLQQGVGGSFSFFSLGDTVEEESLLKGNRLPSYLELSRYVFFTATGEQLDESCVNETRWYLGESSQFDVFMIYRPDIDFLKRTPLNLEFIEEMGPVRSKPRLVIASHKYVDDSFLREHRVEFCQLPFAIYKFRV